MDPQKSTDGEDSERVDNSEEQLKEISLRYGNLIDKVSLRVKNELKMKIQFLNVSKTGPPPNTESKNQNK